MRNSWSTLKAIFKKLKPVIWSVSTKDKPFMEDDKDAKTNPKTYISVLKILATTFGLEFIFGLIWTFMHTSQNFINPVFLK